MRRLDSILYVDQIYYTLSCDHNKHIDCEVSFMCYLVFLFFIIILIYFVLLIVCVESHIFCYYVFPTKNTRLISYFEKPFLENGLESTTYFCFILKGKTK